MEATYENSLTVMGATPMGTGGTGPSQLFEPWDHQWIGPLQLLTTNINQIRPNTTKWLSFEAKT